MQSPADDAVTVDPVTVHPDVPAETRVNVTSPVPVPPLVVRARPAPVVPLVDVIVSVDCDAFAMVRTTVTDDDENLVVAACEAVITVCPAPTIVTTPVWLLIVATLWLFDDHVNAPSDVDDGGDMVKGASPKVRVGVDSAPSDGAPRLTVSVAVVEAAVCVDVSVCLAVIVLVPGVNGVTRPVDGSIVATEVLLDDHVTGADEVVLGAAMRTAVDAVSRFGIVSEPMMVSARDTVIVAVVDAASSVVVSACETRMVAVPTPVTRAVPDVASTATT